MKLIAAILSILVAVPHLAAAEGPPERQQAARLRRAFVERFDTNGDGRLEPRERVRAIRALGRAQRELARPLQAERKRRVIERFDTNRDGNVDRSEMPPGAARRLRRLDRDRDGWIEPGEGG